MRFRHSYLPFLDINMSAAQMECPHEEFSTADRYSISRANGFFANRAQLSVPSLQQLVDPQNGRGADTTLPWPCNACYPKPTRANTFMVV